MVVRSNLNMALETGSVRTMRLERSLEEMVPNVMRPTRCLSPVETVTGS